MLQPSQLYLQLRVSVFRPLGKNLQNHAKSVNYAYFALFTHKLVPFGVREIHG